MNTQPAQQRASSYVVLNLGCGTRTSPAMVNIDFSIYLRVRRNRMASAIAQRVLRGQRLEQFMSLDATIVVHDLRAGIPAADASVDAVYHSHVLEHLDRDAVAPFLREVRRVLKPGGVHRIVVPDLEQAARAYLASVEDSRQSSASANEHDDSVAAMLEQMTRREAFGTSQQPPLRRWLENRLLGDARRRGETHQWMWDEVNLSAVLAETGFGPVRRVDEMTSDIAGWQQIGLDVAADGGPYKPGSLYLEALAGREV